MRVSLTQSEKYDQMLKAVDILFNHKDFGLVFFEIEDAWIYGDTLRDLMLFKNPPINNYQLYIQLKNKDALDAWLLKLQPYYNVKKVNSEFYFDKKHVYSIISLWSSNFDIDYEIQIVVGNLTIKDFLYQYVPVSLSLLSWDISDIFVSLNRKERIEQMIKKVWIAPIAKKDIKNKAINVLKQKWMSKPEHYGFLETYLEKTHQKLAILGYE